MDDLKLFWSFNISSYEEIMNNKKNYLNAFLALILLGNLESFFPLIGVLQDSNAFIFLSIMTTLATFIILSKVVLLQKIQNGGTGQLRYMVISFLLYNLYYSFLFFAGILLFVIPGFYVLIFFSMVPFVAVLDDDCQGSYFVESKILVKKNIKLLSIASIINLLVEFSSLLTSPIQNATVKAITNLIFSVPFSFITLVMTVTFVKIYYYLKKL